MMDSFEKYLNNMKSNESIPDKYWGINWSSYNPKYSDYSDDKWKICLITTKTHSMYVFSFAFLRIYSDMNGSYHPQ